MSALLGAIARVFVAAPASERAAPAVGTAPAVAVCGPAAEPLACALALALRRSGPALVCAWGAGGRRPDVPTGARARRLAGSLAARGLTARATGRLVIVALDRDPAVAAGEAGRAAAAAGEAPVVLALCAARDGAFDDLLAVQDLAIAAAGDAPEEVVRLGVAALAGAARTAVAAPSPSPFAAWAARAGVGAGPSARRALAPALDALGARR